MAELQEACRVKNVGDETFVGTFQGKTTSIPAGTEQGWVKRDEAILWFGDPNAIDHMEGMDLHEDRTKELNRLDTRYGIFPIRRDELTSTPQRTREEAWPKVQVLTMEGEQVHMVVNDPEGIHATPAPAETLEQRQDMLHTIEDMKKRIERYEEKLATAAQPPAEGPDVATDEPTVTRSRGRAS